MANIQSVKSRFQLEEDNRRLAEQKRSNNSLVVLDEPLPNVNIKQSPDDLETIVGTLVDARSLCQAVSQFSIASVVKDMGVSDRHPEKRMRAAYLAFEERNTYAFSTRII